MAKGLLFTKRYVKLYFERFTIIHEYICSFVRVYCICIFSTAKESCTYYGIFRREQEEEKISTPFCGLNETYIVMGAFRLTFFRLFTVLVDFPRAKMFLCVYVTFTDEIYLLKLNRALPGGRVSGVDAEKCKSSVCFPLWNTPKKIDHLRCGKFVYKFFSTSII